MPDPIQQSLVMKLAAVMAAVERIPKRGRNDFHNYDYATEADIVSAIRQELAQRHVMLLPAITGSEREKVGEKGSVLTHLRMEFTFLDGESGETLTRPWLGAGTDKEDKGAYKAMTGGEKYFLLKTFLIPTGDDPEQAEESKRPAERASAAPPRQMPTPTRSAASVVAGKPAASDARATTVTAVKPRNGVTTTGRAYTVFDVTFKDGRVASTFDNKVALAAETCRDSGAEIEPVITPGKKAGTFDLQELVPVKRAS